MSMRTASLCTLTRMTSLSYRRLATCHSIRCFTVTTKKAMTSSFSSSYDPELKKHYITGKTSEYKLGKHRSNALELLDQQAVIEVEADTAICDGGGGALGHPIEYIQLAHMEGKPNECKYCGLRFVQKAGGHHHH